MVTSREWPCSSVVETWPYQHAALTGYVTVLVAYTTGVVVSSPGELVIAGQAKGSAGGGG